MMDQCRPLRVLALGLCDNFGRVVTTNLHYWGYEVVAQSAALDRKVDQTLDTQSFAGDVLLYDLDTLFRPSLAGKDTSVAHYAMLASDAGRAAGKQWPPAPLTIALSSHSVSRPALEQIGAVALLQKPFEMGYLQRYLHTLQRLLNSGTHTMENYSYPSERETIRVLVVDDDLDVVHTIQQCLVDEAGYEVAVAYDGLTALEQCLDWHPQCIVTDLIMPRMNGYQLMRCLSVATQHRTPAFVVTSALTQLEHPVYRSYLEGHSVTYVDKPFNVDHLLSAIRQVCTNRLKVEA